MPPTRSELYSAGAEALSRAWEAADAAQPPMRIDPDDLRRVIAGGELAPRYALVNQLLLKALVPSAGARQLEGVSEAPTSFSPRSLAKNVVVPFDASHDNLLGGSTDPYVSNPLRRASIDGALADDDPAGQWAALIRVLDAVESAPDSAPAVLAAALAAARERQLTLEKTLTIGSALQVRRSSGEDVVEERNELFHRRGPAFLRRLVPHGFDSDGGAQVGSEAEVPWLRLFSKELAPSAQEGWYLVYLFAADGSAAYLVLMQGVTHADGASLSTGAAWVRGLLGDVAGFDDTVTLNSSQGAGSRPDRYEKASTYAKRYDAAAIPSDEELRSDLSTMLGMLQRVYDAQTVGGVLTDDFSALTLERVVEAASSVKLRVADNVVASITAALRAGKHVLLTGAPGTGKTSLAQAVADAAQEIGLCQGSVLTTGTSDWTAADTVGGYWPSTADSSQLVFRPGAVLAAIDAQRWVIVDELNRADIDKAIGQLFTALSGQSVVLPFEEEVDGATLPVAIVPDQSEAPVGTSPHRIGPQWRMIATLNTRDRDLLFSLSYALMRRFAVIDVPVPGREELLEILREKGRTGSPAADARVEALIDQPARNLGPAILLDVAAFVRERLKLTPGDIDQTFADALLAYVLPQLDDLALAQQIAVTTFFRNRVLSGWTLPQVAALVAETFHASPIDLTPSLDDADEDQDAA